MSRLQEFQKFVAGLVHDYGEDKVLGIYEALTEPGDKEQWEQLIAAIDSGIGESCFRVPYTVLPRLLL